MEGTYGLTMLPRELVASGPVAVVVLVVVATAAAAVVTAAATVGAMVAAAAAVGVMVATMATGVVVAMGVVELQMDLGAILLLEVVTALAATLVVTVGLALPVAPLVVMSSLLVAASAATGMTESWMICSRTTSLTTTPTKGPSFCPPSYPSVPVKMRRMIIRMRFQDNL
jgi:hypothetical protein